MKSQKNLTLEEKVTLRESIRNDGRPVITPSDAALLCGIHPRSILKLLRSGQIASVKIGPRYLISKEQFFAWAQGRKIA